MRGQGDRRGGQAGQHGGTGEGTRGDKGTECGRGCRFPFHSMVGRMYGELCDTECNACKPMPHD